jgi:hypothetical protein
VGSKKKLKCRFHPAKGVVQECWAITKAANTSHARRGLDMSQFVNLEGRVTRTLAVLYNGDFKKNGVVLNYCPFCGVKYGPTTPTRKATDERE